MSVCLLNTEENRVKAGAEGDDSIFKKVQERPKRNTFPFVWSWLKVSSQISITYNLWYCT